MVGRSSIQRLTRTGVADLAGVDAQRVVLINSLALLGILITLILLAVGVSTGGGMTLLVNNLVAVGVLGLVLWLHARRRYWGAAVTVSSIVTVATLTPTILGAGVAGNGGFLIVNALLPFLIFPVRHGATAATLSAISVISYALLTHYDVSRFTYQEMMAMNTAFVQLSYVGLVIVMLFIGLFMRRIALEADAGAEAERARAELLLHDVLPTAVADEMIAGGRASARRHGDASVLFANIENFASIAAGLTPVEQVELLDGLYREYDELCQRRGVEKIKSFGDVYMVASGLADSGSEHAERLTAFALELIEVTQEFARKRGRELPIRIGIHSGPVVAGVIGRTRFTYDLWGDTVNTAQRMEANGVPGRVQVSFVTYSKINHRYRCELRDVIEIKGKVPMQTYLVQGALARGVA